MDHEQALVRAFIVPAKQARYAERLGSPKARRQFMADNFHHMADLDSRYARKIDPGMPLVPHTERQDAHVDYVYELLLGLGAPPTCHVISASSELDANEAALRTALEQVIGWHDGTFLSCIPGRLAYFEGEGLNERYILER